MNKFRKWLFKLVFGCDLVEYIDLLHELHKSTRAHMDCLEENIKVCEANGRIIKLAEEVNNRCKWLLERCEELERK